ncbi:hypothetical protein A0H81_07348 [Grifola frondosa]|uniref:Uncharacterized protein n=1 Tax=Grifola frondosa TaxID=5627 RepID=A0A1C7M6E3_GRIFR|nr:hypothetical protein A0H81_07348 [Grifola frondosa]
MKLAMKYAEDSACLGVGRGEIHQHSTSPRTPLPIWCAPLSPSHASSSSSPCPPVLARSTATFCVVPASSEELQKKAQDVLASVQKGLGQAFEAGKKVLGPFGEKAGNALGAYRQPLQYNFSVAREILKQVYTAERLQPPTSLSTITSVYSTLWSRAISPAYWRQLVRSGEWAKVGVYAVEVMVSSK